MNRRLRVLALLLAAWPALSCLPLIEGEPNARVGQELRLTVLHTSDIHSRLIPYDFAPVKTDIDLGLVPEAGPFGGAARMGALLRRERAKADRVLHLDSGDAFQGAPIFNLNSGSVEFQFLSRAKLDAAVVGNHEFDAGPLNFAMQARDNATFPLLAANYFWDDPRLLESNQTGNYTAPYTLRVVNGLRVAVIGMANISSLNSLVEGGNSLQATPIEQNEAARQYVELLKPVTDLIVIVSHLGLTEDQDLIHGYEAFFEYGKALEFLRRPNNRWQIKQWYGPEGDPKSVVQVWIPGVSGIDLVLGGHLHVVLNPPQVLTDPSGRRVVLAHSGAFAKYVGRLDLVVQMPPAQGTDQGAEIVSHEYRVFPLDGLWCDDAMRERYRSNFWEPGAFAKDPAVQGAIARCKELEDPETTQLLLQPILGMDFNLQLTSIFAYAPKDIARRNSSNGGDSPLGNLSADSMRKRRRVEAEIALSNTLGIRDNLYAGPLTHEAMFNVFPFENTINIMYLAGSEIREMFDFVAERSASRGCTSQAQLSGARFTMDCAQVELNDLRLGCDPKLGAEEAAAPCRGIDPGRDPKLPPWQCLDDLAGGRCWAHPAIDIQINGKELNEFATYRVAVNDYIAKGGSGFTVLKRNTTRIETGIALRDSLISYMQQFCTCDDVLAAHRDEDGNVVGKNGQRCGNLVDGKWEIEREVTLFCQSAAAYRDALNAPAGRCSCKDLLARSAEACGGAVSDDAVQGCLTSVPPGPPLGRCSCRDALAGNLTLCGSVTPRLKTFCENPTAIGIAVGLEDGRIGRKVK